MTETLIQVASWFCIGAGSFLGITGALGLFRFPDFYTRLHAASITDTLCAGLVILGLMIHSGFGIMFFKLFLVLFILAYTSPTAAHILAKTARHEGLDPVLDQKKNRKKNQTKRGKKKEGASSIS